MIGTPYFSKEPPVPSSPEPQGGEIMKLAGCLERSFFGGDVLRKENVARKKATLGRNNITNNDVIVEVEVWESL